MDESIKSATVTSLFWKLFEKGGRAVVELAVQTVMARLLAPEEFGALAIMLVFVNVGNVVVTSGLNTALVQAEEIDEADLSTVFWLSFGASAVLFLAVFAAAPAIAGFYSMPYIVWPLRALGLLLLITAFNSVQVAIVQRRLQFRKVFNATAAASVASGAVGIVAALAGTGLWALVIQQLCYQSVRNSFVREVESYWDDSWPHDAILWLTAEVKGSLALYDKRLVKFRRHCGNASARSKMNREARIEDIEHLIDRVGLMKRFGADIGSLNSSDILALDSIESWLKARLLFLNTRSLAALVSVIRGHIYYATWKGLPVDCALAFVRGATL